MAYAELATAPVDACFLVKCDSCGKTTWKVRSPLCSPDHRHHPLAIEAVSTFSFPRSFSFYLVPVAVRGKHANRRLAIFPSSSQEVVSNGVQEG